MLSLRVIDRVHMEQGTIRTRYSRKQARLPQEEEKSHSH